MRPGELQRRSGVAASTASKYISELKDRGLITGNKRSVRLTPRGAQQLAATSAPPAEPTGPSALVDRWPTPGQQAFLRLGIACVVARHAYGDIRPADLLNVAAIGRGVGTGKSLAGLFIGRTVGLRDEQTLIRLPDRKPAEILGRTERGDDGWRFVPAPALARPFVALDEYDKAGSEQRGAALALLDHGPRFEREGETHQQAATVMLAGNRDTELPDYARRRAIVLDVDALSFVPVGAIQRLARDLDRLYRSGHWSVIDLDVATGVLELADAERQLAGDLLSRSLTEDRLRVTNPGAVELLAICYAAAGLASDDRAGAIQATTDYLLIQPGHHRLPADPGHHRRNTGRLVDRPLPDDRAARSTRRRTRRARAAR